jgi:hypothetical protein
MKNLTSLINSKPIRERVIGKSELNNKVVYCVKWDGCKSARGLDIDEKYEWESPSTKMSDMITV